MNRCESRSNFNIEHVQYRNDLLSIQTKLLDLSTEAIFAWDLNGDIIYWNKGAEIMYGYGFSEAIGCNSNALLKTKPVGMTDDLEAVLHRDGAWYGEAENRTKDGRTLNILTRHQIVLDQCGNRIILEINHDITSRKMAEEKLQWNRKRAEILFEVTEKLLSSENPIELIDELCTKVMRFLGCQVFINYIIDQSTSQLCLNACVGVPEELKKMMEKLDYGMFVCGSVAQEGKNILLEDVQHSPDPLTNIVKSMGLNAYACYCLTEKNSAIGTISFGSSTKKTFRQDELMLMKAVANQIAVAVSRVNAERLMIEHQNYLINAEKEENLALLKAIEIKDEFISLISHEFRTPLTVIISAVQAMEHVCKAELSTKANGFINCIRHNANRQLKLINNLLDITRYNADRLKVRKTNVEIVSFTRQIIQSIEIIAKQKGILLRFRSSLKRALISLDEEKYERILLNLLSNAVKFTPTDKSIDVVISKRVKDRLPYLAVEVKDRGIGIPQDKIELIFERFGQVDNSLSRSSEGTGIGLSLVKKFVELLQGEIICESELGVGSSFTVLLPMQTIADPEQKEARDDADVRLIRTVDIEFSDIYV